MGAIKVHLSHKIAGRLLSDVLCEVLWEAARQIPPTYSANHLRVRTHHDLMAGPNWIIEVRWRFRFGVIPYRKKTPLSKAFTGFNGSRISLEVTVLEPAIYAMTQQVLERYAIGHSNVDITLVAGFAEALDRRDA